ncbi:MAG: class II aldolase/adducin family protein [Chthonomonadales bacterium]
MSTPQPQYPYDPSEDLAQERAEVASFMRRIYHLGLTSSTGGNVSRKAPNNRIVITPASLDKARIRPRDVAVMDLSGALLTPGIHASSESLMHLALYRRYPHIGAVIHAHPVTASAFACSTTPIRVDLTCETYALLDPPILAPYALSGTEELARSVADAAGASSCILLQNHAVLTTGADLLEAFRRLELLEEAARITLITRQLDGVRTLSPEEKSALDRLVGRRRA